LEEKMTFIEKITDIFNPLPAINYVFKPQFVYVPKTNVRSKVKGNQQLFRHRGSDDYIKVKVKKNWSVLLLGLFVSLTVIGIVASLILCLLVLSGCSFVANQKNDTTAAFLGVFAAVLVGILPILIGAFKSVNKKSSD
jgi:hypothetical protein